MQNIVFLPYSPEIRSRLFTLGLDFLTVTIENTFYFMVVTNQLKLMKQLAKLHKQCKIYISDSRRQTFRLDLIGDDYFPTKLGTLKRSMSQSSGGLATPGTSFLVVNENNNTYHYIVE